MNKGEDKAADFYRASQFKRYLYRPDIVNDTLALGSSHKAIKKAGMEEITVADLILRAPVDVRIASVKMLDSGHAEVSIKLGKNKTTTPERITMYVNGAQMLTQAQRQLKNIRPGDTLQYKINLPYNETKDNHLKVIVENEWAETGDEIRFENTKWTKSDKPEGTLYVTAIGINRYPLLPLEQQLKSTGLDAKSIVNRFKKLEGLLYKKVLVNLITDENRQKPIYSKEIAEMLIQQAQKAGPVDTMLIFLAGHGVTDAKGSYHFVTADTVVNATQGEDIVLKGGTSFDWKRLHKILDSTMGKRIVIVDTCQAGEVLSGTTPDISRLVKDIHDVNAIIYSGTSRQQAGVGTKKGGVFTQTILAGIDGSAVYNDETLLFTSLRKYVDVETPRLNREIMLNIYRGVVIKQKKKKIKVTSESEVDFDATQRPVAVLPDGMNNFIIYRKGI